MTDIAILNVKFTGDTSAMDRAFSAAERSATSFKKRVDSISTINVTADISSFERSMDQAASKAASTSREIQTSLSSITVDPIDIDVDTSAIDAAERDIHGLKATSAGANDTITITADANTTPAKTKIDALSAMTSTADSEVTINVDADTAGATAQLGALEVPKAVAEEDIHIDVDVDTTVATAQLATFTATAAGVQTISGMLTSSMALMSLGAVGLAGALVMAMASVGPLLGGIGALVGLSAGAATGFGLIAAATYVMTQGLYDGGAAFQQLKDQAGDTGQQVANALGPASLTIAEIGQSALFVAQSYIPMLGPAATASAAAAQAGLQPLFDFLLTQTGMGYFQQIFGYAAPIVHALTQAASFLIMGILPMLATVVPYGYQLAAAIRDVAAQFALWANSAEGASQITTFVQSAIPVFQALWNMVTSVGGALLNFATVAGGDLAVAINVITVAVTGIINGLTWLYETVGGAGIAFGLMAAAVAVVGGALVLGAGVIGTFIAAAAPFAAIAAAIAVAATLIYNNWSTVGPVFEQVSTAIQTGLQAGYDWIVGTFVPGIQAAWSAVWAFLEPTVSAALTAVSSLITTVITQVSTIWNDFWATVGTTPGTALATLTTIVQTAMTALQAVFTTVFPIIQAGWMVGWTMLQTVVTAAWAVIAGVVQGGINIIAGIIQMWIALFTGNWTLFWQGLGLVVQGALQVIAGIVQAGITLIQGIFTAGWTFMSTLTQTVFGATIPEILTAAWELISGAVTTGIEAVKSVLQSGWDAVTTATSTAWDAITSALSTAWTAITTAVQTGVDTVTSVMQAAWDVISAAVTTVWTAISTTITTWWTTISTTVTEWTTTITTTMQTAWDTITAAVTAAWTLISETITTWWTTISETVTSWTTTITDTMQVTWDTITAAVETAWDAIWVSIDSWWTSISETVTSWTETITTAIQDAWDAIVAGAESFGSLLYDTLYDGFWTAVSGAGEALASLLDGVQAALDGLGIDIGIDVGGAAASIRDATAYAKGGMAMPVTMFAAGGLGTSRPKGQMHLWNEGMGNEAFVAERGPANRQMGILNAAASWFDATVVPNKRGHGGKKGLDDPRGTRFAMGLGFANGGCAMDQMNIPIIPHQLGDAHWSFDPGAQQAAEKANAGCGNCATMNTYYGHSYRAGCPEENNIDFWGPGGRGDPIDPACGHCINGILSPQATYTIFDGYMSDLGAYPEDPHYDHVHAALCGAGGSGFMCKSMKAALQALVTPLTATAHTAVDALAPNETLKGLGHWAIDEPIQKIIDYIISLVPSCAGGGAGSGDCYDAIPKAVEQLGAPSEYLESMKSLGEQESGMNMGAVNDYDSNAMAGTPSSGCWQMIPSTFEAWADPSCTDPNDALCQAMSSINYQQGHHGGPVWNSGYLNGGVIPGSIGRKAMIQAHAGERVLTERQNQALEAFLANPAASGAGSGGGYIAGNANVDQSQSNQVFIEVNVEGGVGMDEQSQRQAAERIANETGAQVVDIMQRVNDRTRSNRRGVARRFS